MFLLHDLFLFHIGNADLFTRKACIHHAGPGGFLIKSRCFGGSSR